MTYTLPKMRRLLFCLFSLVGLAVGSSYATESATLSAIDGSSVTPVMDINKTVLEVEKLLDKYPELPRIDRSEILSILQNITEEDNAKLKDELAGVLEEETQKMQKNSESKEKTGKSVMVVLPFQAEDAEESLEELYTRSPIVRMEKQKDVIMKVTTSKPTTTTTQATEPPPFSIIEKHDNKFNPPLRIIGYRYHTSAPPAETPTTKTYVNYHSPEQVTMAFPSQEATSSVKWNHKENANTETKPGIVFDEALEPDWGNVQPPTGPKDTFHLPENIDNFSLEDVMVSKEEYDIPQTTTFKITDISLTTTEESVKLPMFITPMPPKQKEVAFTEEYFKTTTPGTYKKKYKTKAKAEKTTKAPKPDNLASVVETLPLDMKTMLSNLGLDSKSIVTSSTTTESPAHSQILSLNPQIDPSSYFKFKPLPLKREKTISEDMQDFLASFGLLDGLRQQKAVAEENVPFNDKFLESAPEINTDMLSDSMKKTLDSLGLYEKTSRKHIFNPSNHSSVQTEDEIEKLNALLNTIKKLASLNDSEPVTPEFQREILQQVKDLDNITTSYKTSAAINEEIHKIMEKSKGKFKIPLIMHESEASGNLQKGPEPEFFEEIQLKNEIKRQENGSTTTTAEPESSSTTEEPSNSPDLEGAFGGGETAGEGADPSESLPPKRPNGLYLLLDWNTFFEVGTDDDKRRVNIRFQPKVGDGRNFLPVTIP